VITGVPIARAAPKLSWLRGLASFEDGHVVLEGRQAEIYDFSGDPDLLFDLAAVRVPADALGLVRRYGLLWAGADVSWEGLDEDERREQLPESVFREPFADWERVAKQLNNILRFFGALQHARQGESTQLEWLRLNYPGDTAALLGDPNPPDAKFLDAVADTSATFVTFRIEGTGGRFFVTARHPSGFALAPAASILEGYAWLQLAQTLAEQVPLQTREECNRVFTQTHKARRHCSKQCAGRARSRRYYQKLRQQS
jgi:hypothetical protein